MYTPELDRRHIRWALAGAQRFPKRAPYFGSLIRFALARLKENGHAFN